MISKIGKELAQAVGVAVGCRLGSWQLTQFVATISNTSIIVSSCFSSNSAKIKNEDDLKNKDKLRNEDNLKNEHSLKHGDNLKNKNNLEN